MTEQGKAIELRRARAIVAPEQSRDDAGSAASPLPRPVLFSAARCTARYVVLPFVLPLLGVVPGAAFGVVTGASVGLLVAFDLIAAVSIYTALRRLWTQQHPRKWQYLAAALALAALVGLFFANDVRVLYA